MFDTVSYIHDAVAMLVDQTWSGQQACWSVVVLAGSLLPLRWLQDVLTLIPCLCCCRCCCLCLQTSAGTEENKEKKLEQGRI